MKPCALMARGYMGIQYTGNAIRCIPRVGLRVRVRDRVTLSARAKVRVDRM